MLLATKIVLGATIVADVALLFFLTREKTSFAQRIFLLYVLGITGWGIAIFANLWLHSARVEMLVFAFAALFLTAQVWFAQIFPDGALLKRPILYGSIGLGLFFFFASFIEGAIFSTLSFSPDGYTMIGNGFLSAYYSLFALVYVSAPVALLVRTYRCTTDPSLKAQLKYLTIGFSIFLGVNIFTNSVLPVFFGIFAFNALGPVFSLIFAATVFYIIWKHQFLNVRFVVQRGLIYSTLVAGIIGAYIALLFILKDAFDPDGIVAAPVSAAIIAVLGTFSIAPLERFLRRKTDRLFFKDTYEYPEALQRLIDVLAAYNTPQPLIKETLATLAAIIRPKSVSFAPGSVPHGSSDDMNVPVVSKNHILGTIVLGRKRSGDSYTRDDMRLLTTFANGFGIALEKAELYQRVEEHSHELEKKVTERTKHLQEIQEYQRRMMSDISHALQTPLTVLRASLRDITEHPSSLAKTFQIEESVDKLSRLLYELLHLAKLETMPKVHHEPFSLSDTVCHIAEYVETNCEQHDIQLVRQMEPGLTISGDRRQIEELVTNLLSNAVRYTKQCAKRRITVLLRRVENDAEIVIADTGIGIPAYAIGHVFERFYRVENNTESGTGLGLAICKQIADLHHGSMFVESIEGQGSAFTARFPLVSSTPRAR